MGVRLEGPVLENIVNTNNGYDGEVSGTGRWIITSNNNLVITLTDEDDIEIRESILDS